MAVLLGVAGWLLLKRPLWVWTAGTRRSLRGSQLKRVIVPSPVGPQTVFVGGAGPLLVLLHGAGDQAGTWAKVAPSLVQRYTLVIPDLAGHGASAPATGPIETAAVFAGLEAVLAREAQGRRMTLVGNSLGAWMAMVLAKRHPEWVDRVVAVNGGALKGSGSSVNLLPRNRQEARETMAQLRDPGRAAVPDSVLDDMVRQGRESSLARFASTAASMGDWVLDEAQLRTLQVPVRLIWGTSDRLMPMEYAQRLQNALPDVELITLDRCGHVPQQEAPKRFLEALGRALAEPAPSNTGAP
jgi:pimeloyl-ACP methyl ester carboxylesterase